MVQPIYWHLTTWQKDDPGLKVGTRLTTTAWDESCYWKSKRDLRQLEDTRATLANSVSSLRSTLASLRGQFVFDVTNIRDELREGFELMQRGADQASLDKWVQQAARSKLEWEWEKEQRFEQVRERDFASLPSRKRCMFLLDHGVAPTTFAAKYAFPASRILLGIEPVPDESTLFRADISALDFPRLPPEQIEACARTYWAGAPDGHDPLRIEIILEGAFTVRSIQSLADYVGPDTP